MKKLKVTWQDGNWNRDGQQPIASVELPEKTKVRHVGEGTLVFETPGDGVNTGARIALVVPEQRLISAVQVEADNG